MARQVIIKSLENIECLALIEVIHGKRHFDQKMFCNGYIPLTPEKEETPRSDLELDQDSSEKPLPHLASDSVGPQEKPLPPLAINPVDSLGKPLPPVVKSTVGSSEPSVQHGKPLPPSVIPDSLAPQADMVQEKFSFSPQPQFGLDNFSSDQETVRRFSLSLLDRTPPPNSLAADILGSSNLNLGAAKSLLSKISDMQETLSDFNSCAESFQDSSSSSDESEPLKQITNIAKTLNDRKRERIRKRKMKQTPDKGQFLLKKPNTQKTPQ